jgi:hypothetical protein
MLLLIKRVISENWALILKMHYDVGIVNQVLTIWNCFVTWR